MTKIDKLTVRYHGEVVGVISLTPDDKRLAFEYDPHWIADGFSISPLELPLKTGLFLAKPTPLYGNFGIFEDSLPDGYGRYLLHKALLREGIDDRNLSVIERLSIVGSNGMGALTYEPETIIGKEKEVTDFDMLQQKALEAATVVAAVRKLYTQMQKVIGWSSSVTHTIPKTWDCRNIISMR